MKETALLSKAITPTGPTIVSRYDKPGSYSETLTMSATPNVSAGRPTGTESIADIESLSRSYTNAARQTTHTDNYFNLTGLTYSTSTTLGTENTHFYRTTYGYDSFGRQSRVRSPTGTITRTVFDSLSRISSTWVGLDDTLTTSSWSPTNTSGTDLVKITENVYDGGGIGDGNLTKTTVIPGGSEPNRATEMYYDWRNRTVATKSGVETGESTSLNRTIYYTEYDNLGQAIISETYDGDAVTIADSNSDGVPDRPSSSLLRSKSVNSFDDQGRVYRTQFSVSIRAMVRSPVLR